MKKNYELFYGFGLTCVGKFVLPKKLSTNKMIGVWVEALRPHVEKQSTTKENSKKRRVDCHFNTGEFRSAMKSFSK